MRDLNYELKIICKSSRDGSFATQSARNHVLQQVADELHQLGYKKLKADNLKPKHIVALVSHWQSKELAPGTIKNRMSHVRWLTEKLGRSSIVASNTELNIDRRVHVDNDANKSRELNYDKLANISDPYTAASLELQRAFGLRREEAIKFSSSYADRGDKLVLKGSWCKGGRVREIPVKNQHQRDVLDRIKTITEGGALIRPDRNYIQQLKIYERETIRVGLDRNHGLRHSYAQDRYKEIAGFKCPAAGGKISRELTLDEKLVDQIARQKISRELGHEREQITAIYLGR